uniref:basic leucine zipper 4-like n=1 Tax=Erigeron canadensis TaxID=72917 RepID=UPI001CB8C32E|nr:basic leucine zipper 4-like [Erigeron canadensis]
MSSSSFNSSNDDSLTFDGFLDNILVDFPPQSPILFPPGSDNSNILKTNTSNSSSDSETNTWEAIIKDERKRKRKISNRESARRSRLRKQKHLENLTNQVTRYKSGNQELINRLRFVNQNWQIVRHENERMRVESVMLQQKLYNLHQLLVVPDFHQVPILQSAWPCNNNVTTIIEQNLPSLITFES